MKRYLFLSFALFSCAAPQIVYTGFDCDGNMVTALMVQGDNENFDIDSVFAFSVDGRKLVSFRSIKGVRDGCVGPVYIKVDHLMVGDSVIIEVFSNQGHSKEKKIVRQEYQE